MTPSTSTLGAKQSPSAPASTPNGRDTTRHRLNQKVVVKKQDVTPTTVINLVNTIIKERQGKKAASAQVRPTTKRGQRSVAPTPKDIQLQELPAIPFEAFLKTSCELKTPLNVFAAIYGLSHGQPCVDCSYDVHSKTGCPAKQKLLRKRGLIK